jgi:hypothetical protein
VPKNHIMKMLSNGIFFIMEVFLIGKVRQQGL